jgi:hypothetical protein
MCVYAVRYFKKFHQSTFYIHVIGYINQFRISKQFVVNVFVLFLKKC